MDAWNTVEQELQHCSGSTEAFEALRELRLTEPEKELLVQMMSDYFDALDRNGVEDEQPELYKELSDRSDSIERKLGLK